MTLKQGATPASMKQGMAHVSKLPGSQTRGPNEPPGARTKGPSSAAHIPTGINK